MTIKIPEWFCGLFVIVIIVVGLYLVASAVTHGEHNRAARWNMMYTCQDCGEEVVYPDNKDVCPRCGYYPFRYNQKAYRKIYEGPWYTAFFNDSKIEYRECTGDK